MEVGVCKGEGGKLMVVSIVSRLAQDGQGAGYAWSCLVPWQRSLDLVYVYRARGS